MKKVLLTVLIFGLLFLHTLSVVFALGATDIATSYKIDDGAAVTGDIISNSSKGLNRSANDYDIHIFGVYTETATVAIRSVDTAYKLIVQSGTTNVNVVDANGPIKKGDYITTSAKFPGKGQKATISGYVLGISLADFTEKSGVVSVAVRPEYAEISNARTLSRLLDYFTAGLFRNISDQGQFPVVMRYIIAGLIMLASAIISFVTFSRSVPKAIEAIGRNPLAKSSILLSLALSITLVIVTLVIGLIASIVILRV